MSDAIKQLHAFVDGAVEKLKVLSAEKGKPVTCKGVGCCHCCYEQVYCSSKEVAYILDGLNIVQRVALSQYVQRAVELIKPFGLFDKDMPPVLEWLKMKLACPFLEEGKCMVYERRPYACRIHLAVNDPDWCRDRRMEQKYPMFDDKGQMALGKATMLAHMEDGEMRFDNMLALLDRALNGSDLETASASLYKLEQEEPKC